MPFNRLGAMLKGQRDVGGTGRAAQLSADVPMSDLSPAEMNDGPDLRLPKATDLVLVYRTKRDNRVRPSHAALEGQTWEIDDHTAPVPPLGYGCRCRVDIVQRSAATARAPQDEAAALKRFPDLEKNVQKYMGKEIAALYEAGDLKASDLLTETGDPINVTQARVIAAARQAGKKPGPALVALAQLNGMGLDDRAVRSLAAKAQDLVDKGAKTTDATRAAINGSTRIGGIASRSKATQAMRTSRAVARIKATGLLGYDQPDVPPSVAAPAALTPPTSPAPVRAVPAPTQRVQVPLEGRPITQPTAPPTLTGPAPIAPDYVTAAELQIARRTTERILVWDKTGKLVGDAEGGIRSVSIPASLPPDAIMTHNHPSAQTYPDSSPKAWGTSLSRADIIAAASGKAARIRAVSPSGMVFEMARPPGGWPSLDSIVRLHRTFDRLVSSEMWRSIQDGAISAEQAEADHAHLVNSLLARIIGAAYTWGRHA